MKAKQISRLSDRDKFRFAMEVKEHVAAKKTPYESWDAAVSHYSNRLGRELTRCNLMHIVELSGVEVPLFVASSRIKLGDGLQRRIDELESRVMNLETAMRQMGEL